MHFSREFYANAPKFKKKSDFLAFIEMNIAGKSKFRIGEFYKRAKIQIDNKVLILH